MNIIAIVLGVVEGLTEFIPVSSTGHLILTGHLMGFKDGLAATFEVFIQLGAILAITVVYREKFAELLSCHKENGGFAGPRGLLFLGISTGPALVAGLLGHRLIKAYLFTPFTVAVGLGVGAVWLLVTEFYLSKGIRRGLEAMTWRDALGVGLFQCLALWPGMSRSASTILGGMMIGLDRKAATEYSFFAAVPVMIAACLYELSCSTVALDRSHIVFFLLGFFVSFVSALLAIRFFIRFLSRHTLIPFGWYRLILAGIVFWVLA